MRYPASESKANRLAVGILIGILIGIVGLYIVGMLVQAPQYHTDIERATTIFVEWPVSPPTDVYLTPSMLSSRQGLVGTPLSVIDIRTFVARLNFYNNTMPESIWAWSLNGTVCAVMRVLGPLVFGDYGNVWYVEISRLTMSKLTIYLPDGTVEIMPNAFSSTTPLVGYTAHFYYVNGAGFQDLFAP